MVFMHLMKFLQFKPHGYNGINIQNEIKLAKKKSCSIASVAQTPLPLGARSP